MRCERLFFTTVFCDGEHTNGGTISFVLDVGREAREIVGRVFGVSSKGVKGDETGMKHFLSQELDTTDKKTR